MNKNRLIITLRWLAVLPIHIVTPFIIYFIVDLCWHFRPTTGRYGIPEDVEPSHWWIDIVCRVLSFLLAVEVAPSHKKIVFSLLFGAWIVFSIVFSVVEIGAGGSMLILIPFVPQVLALLVLYWWLKNNDFSIGG